MLHKAVGIQTSLVLREMRKTTNKRDHADGDGEIGGSFPMMDFSRSSKHQAKKPHKCFLCGGEISTGEKYERYSGRYDGEFF